MQLLSILSRTTGKSFTKLAYKQYNIKKKKVTSDWVIFRNIIIGY